jgi:predicted RNase H-like HicB family nuclease
MAKTLRCYAQEHSGEWEAICLDLDIAVQGASFEEVFHSLDDAVQLYLESVKSLPESERDRLLNRPAPLSVRLKFFEFALKGLFRSNNSGDLYHQFTMPVAA